MANGDDATSVGFDVVSGSADRRQGYDEINKTRDYIARHQRDGGHAWDKITGRPTLAVNATNNTVPVRDGSGRLTTQPATLDAHVPQYAQVKAAAAAAAAAQTTANAAAAAAQGVAGKADRWNGEPTSVGYANGPTGAAYGRQAGNNRFQVWMDDSYQFGRATSSLRFKEDVAGAGLDPAAILALRPVTYHRKADPPDTRELGLIAEEVHEHLPDVVTWYGGKIDGIRYDLLVVPLITTVQHLHAEVERLRALVEPDPTQEV